jgi:thiamine transporter
MGSFFYRLSIMMSRGFRDASGAGREGGKTMTQNETNPTKRQIQHEAILATASGGMAIALGTMLSIFTVIRMPQGGSLTVGSMLPIILCALAFGPAWGLGIAAVYGVLQFVVAPYVVHWASFLLDYPVAFGLLGLAGFFAGSRRVRLAEPNILRRIGQISLPRLLLAVFVAMAGRLAAHVGSGVIFFASYASVGQNIWLYSIGYNGSFMLPELVITTVLLLPLAIFLRRPAGQAG